MQGQPTGGSRPAKGKVDQLARLLGAEPFCGRVGVRCHEHHAPSHAPVPVWVAVPASDEAGFIGQALRALDRSAGAQSRGVGVVVLANNCRDQTLSEARAALRSCEAFAASVLLDVVFDGTIADAGHARRLAMDVAAMMPDCRELLTTDADGLVDRRWIATASAALRNADLACGSLSVDPHELAGLPGQVARCGQAEAVLAQSLDHLWHAVTGPAPAGFRNRGSGANMAITAGTYRRLGGLPPLPSNEDRALHALVADHGLRIAHVEAMHVRVSCRLVSSATGGMSDCLTDRCLSEDPYLDAELMPADTLARRALFRRSLQGDVPLEDEHTLAGQLGAHTGFLRELVALGPVQGWLWGLAALPALSVRRMRMSDAFREVRRAERLLAHVERLSAPPKVMEPPVFARETALVGTHHARLS